MLAFLKWNKTHRAWATVGLSYGSKVVEPKALETYLARMDELKEIRATPRDAPPPPELLEWLVRCAEQPATRWEGAYELGGFALIATLTEAQRKRLVESLLRTPSVTLGEAILASALRDVPSRGVDDMLVRGLREAFERKQASLAVTLLETISQRTDSPAAKTAVMGYEEHIVDEEKWTPFLRKAVEAIERERSK